MTSGRRRHDPIRTMLVYDAVVIRFLDPCVWSAITRRSNASFQEEINIFIDPDRCPKWLIR
jgi:hypothetical protein